MFRILPVILKTDEKYIAAIFALYVIQINSNVIFCKAINYDFFM